MSIFVLIRFRIMVPVRLKISTFQLKCYQKKRYLIKFKSVQKKFVQLGALQKCQISTQSINSILGDISRAIIFLL